MKTTIMFVSDSEPLTNAPVRLPGGDELYVTDQEGKVELDLDLGTHTFEIQVGDKWMERTVHRQGHSPLFVVNVNQSPTPNVTTLNTLQIDLSNLVGDRYVFETVLGRGGMGVVVKAIDRMLNRPVAIKMLSDELRENEEAQQIFLVEARNLATLSHPNLVAIHDILNVGGRVLMVFEYVLGENVEKKIKKHGRLDQKDVLRIAIQLTRCVAYLHEHELIHRDLKPANIIMQSDGTLKLIDFGLARSLNDLYIRGTRVRGTPAYMAPEQIQGIHLTASTDLYQIGISMYEMLTGKLPFSSGDMAYAHVHLEPPPIRDKFPEVDPDLADLVARCLAKQAKNRPASAEELLEGLQHIYARLVNQESDPFQDSIHTGPLPRITSPNLPAVSAAHSSAMELEEALDSSSNTMTYAVIGIGVVALALTGFLLLGGNGEESSNVAETPEALAAQVEQVPTSVAPNAEPEESAPVETPPLNVSISSAMTAVQMSAMMAAGQAAGRASADAEKPAAPVRQPVRSRPRTVTKSAPSQAAKPAVEEVKAPAATAAQAAPEKKETKKPLFAPTEEKKSGLLSVDKDSSKPLLPVSK